jgi:hypothetical protein
MTTLTHLADCLVSDGIRNLDDLTYLQRRELTRAVLVSRAGEEVMRDAAGALAMVSRASVILQMWTPAALENFARDLLARAQVEAEPLMEEALSDAMARAGIRAPDVEAALDARDRARDVAQELARRVCAARQVA